MYGGGNESYGGGGGYGGDGGHGGASQFAGGGFMPGGGGGGDHGGSGGSGFKGGAGSASSAGMWPLTVRQIGLQAGPGEEGLLVHGQIVTTVTIVGRVLSREVRSTDATLVLDDGTGTVDVKQWMENDIDEHNRLNSFRQNMYLRVYGHLRVYDGKRSIQAFSMRPIVDMNEVTFHFLECIYVSMSQKTIQGGEGPTPTTPVKASGGSAYATSQLQSPYSSMPPPSTAGSANDLQGRVMAIYEDPSSAQMEAGLPFYEVAKRIAGYTAQQVKDAIDFLVNEGHLYSTIDDEHFKSTNV